MSYYAVRITHSYAIAQRIVTLWSLRCDKVLVYEHIGGKTGKPHIHLALYNTSIDKKQLRNIARVTGIPVEGNEYMSFKKWNRDETYLSYMSKGKHDPSYNKGYTDEELQRIKAGWIEKTLDPKDDNDDKLLNEFDQYLVDKNIDHFTLTFSTIKTHAKAFVFSRHSGSRNRWNARSMIMYRTIVMTNIIDLSITVPPDEQKFKW